MKISFLTRQRTILDQPVEEPTLVAMGLTVLGLAVLLALCVVAMAALPALGFLPWAFAASAALLAWLVLGLRRQQGLAGQTGRQRWFRRILACGRMLFIGVLTGWLGLI